MPSDGSSSKMASRGPRSNSSSGSNGSRKRRKPKSEPTSSIRVVVSTLIIYLSYQILTREEDDISKTNLHVPNFHFDSSGGGSHNWQGGAGHGGNGGGSHTSFPDPFGLGHQIAGAGSNFIHQHTNLGSALGGSEKTESEARSIVMRILAALAGGIYSVISFIWHSLNSTLLLLLSLAYYLASPLSAIFFTVTSLLLSPFQATWGVVNWVWEPIGKWIGGFILTGVGLGAGIAWIGNNLENLLKRWMASFRSAISTRVSHSWLGRLFGKAEVAGPEYHPDEAYHLAQPRYLSSQPIAPPYGIAPGYPYSHTAYPYPVGMVHQDHQIDYLPSPHMPAYPFVPAPYFPTPLQPRQQTHSNYKRKNESSRRQAKQYAYTTPSKRRERGRLEEEGEGPSASSGSSESELDPEAILLGKRGQGQAKSSGKELRRQVEMIDPSSSASSGLGSGSTSGSGSASEGTPTRASGRHPRGSSKGMSRAGAKRTKAIHFHFHPGSIDETMTGRSETKPIKSAKTFPPANLEMKGNEGEGTNDEQ
jgi:hypothetical protein